MSGIVEYSVCGCGGDSIYELNTNSFEESEFCLKCGKLYHSKPQTDENGKGVYETLIDEQGNKTEKLLFTSKQTGGFGTLKLGWSTTQIESKEHGLKLLEEMKQRPEGFPPLKHCWLYFHDEETNTGEVVWGEDNPDVTKEDRTTQIDFNISFDYEQEKEVVEACVCYRPCELNISCDDLPF